MHLFDLPVEVRLLIWEHYLDSTTLTLDLPSPPPHPLSVLRASRQLQQEIRPLVEPLVTLSFRHNVELLDRFSVLPASQLARIRRIELRARPVFLNPFEHSVIRLVDALTLLPDLQLSTLSLYHEGDSDLASDDYEDDKSALMAWRTVFDFILHGHEDRSWSELHAILPLSDSLFDHLKRNFRMDELKLFLIVIDLLKNVVVELGTWIAEQIKTGQEDLPANETALELFLQNERAKASSGVVLHNGVRLSTKYHRDCQLGQRIPAVDMAPIMLTAKRTSVSHSTTTSLGNDVTSPIPDNTAIAAKATRLPVIYRDLNWQQIKRKARSRSNFENVEDDYRRRMTRALWDEDPFVGTSTSAA